MNNLTKKQINKIVKDNNNAQILAQPYAGLLNGLHFTIYSQGKNIILERAELDNMGRWVYKRLEITDSVKEKIEKIVENVCDTVEFSGVNIEIAKGIDEVFNNITFLNAVNKDPEYADLTF